MKEAANYLRRAPQRYSQAAGIIVVFGLNRHFEPKALLKTRLDMLGVRAIGV
jgi:hypothetical protein